MTLLDLRNDILTILSNKHYVSETEDFPNILFSTNGGEALKNAALKEVLKQLVDLKIVSYCPVKIDNQKPTGYWVLNRSAAQLSQNIEILPHTSSLISCALKNYSEFSDIPISMDALNVSERDIQVLAVAVETLINYIKAMESDEDDARDSNIDKLNNSDA